MDMSVILALATAVAGVIPLVLTARFAGAAVAGVVTFLLSWWIYYGAAPSLVWPLFGAAGFLTVFVWVIGAFVSSVDRNYGDSKASVSWVFAIGGFALYLILGISGCDALHTSHYSGLIGDVPVREWTQDVQPKDPAHVRLVPLENAIFRADKRLGEIGAIGSQFHVADGFMTLQKVRGDLWYVTHLDFNGYGVWSNVGHTPGYVMVNAEDPLAQVVVKTDHEFQYTPEAWFGKNLERHVWRKYPNKGLTDWSLELDDTGKPWWVVTVFHPTVRWWGEVVEGAVIVDPETGDMTFHKLGEIPDWVDRVMPGWVTESYIDMNGVLANGFWNILPIVGAQAGLTEADYPSIIYGSDSEPYWVTGVTSTSGDSSLVAFIYTHTRTGKSVRYNVAGNTSDAVLAAVNNEVHFKRWHGTDPVLYNISGVMTDVVPILGEASTFQGVALVRVDNLQTAIGESINEAYRKYQSMLAQGGSKEGFDTAHDRNYLTGAVVRIAAEVRDGSTMYFVQLADIPHLFTGSSELSPKLPLTREGDEVDIAFIASGQDVEPMLAFNNRNVVLQASDVQNEVRSATQNLRREERSADDGADARKRINEMTDEELAELLKKKQ
ncbi:MAG TPA: hypothetical protein VD862_02320 [Candidatus Paceibacterota bacterium]|nr:hypothetical protein [Candidatus Paceibacterota bacterium]